MFTLVGLKADSKGAPAPMTKTADRSRRNIKTNWSHLMHRRSHKLLAPSLYPSNYRPSVPFAISTVMTRMSQLKVIHQLHVTTEGTCQTTPLRHDLQKEKPERVLSEIKPGTADESTKKSVS